MRWTRRITAALGDRDHQIAAVRGGNANGAVSRAVRHVEIVARVRPAMSATWMTLPGFQRREPFADQVEIGDAVDLVVIGDAGVAIAEADLGPDVDSISLAAGRALQ